MVILEYANFPKGSGLQVQMVQGFIQEVDGV